jgi:hypothetical protein
MAENPQAVGTHHGPELIDVLTAFRDRDPNRNGKADEIPWASWGPSILNSWPMPLA